MQHAARDAVALSSIDRKRLRDRRAQQKLRERRDIQIKELQEQLAACRRNHGGMDVQRLFGRIHSLEAENSMLRQRRQTYSQSAKSLQRQVSELIKMLGEETPTSIYDSALAADEPTALLPAPPDPRSINPSPGPDSIPSASQIARGNRLYLDTIGATVREPELFEMDHRLARSKSPCTAMRTPLMADFDFGFCSNNPARLNTTHGGGSGSWSTARTNNSLFEICDMQSSAKNHPEYHTDRRYAQSDAQGTQLSEQECTHGSSSFLSAQSPRIFQPVTPVLSTPVAIRAPPTPSTPPEWTWTPFSDFDHPKYKELTPWLRFPQSVTASPAVPEPVELLLGSRKNHLANEIHLTLRKSRIAEPERLAIGWFLYVYSKWIVEPTKETYDLVPSYFHPTPDQMQTNHPPSFDVVLWPEVRNNLINEAHCYSAAEVLSLLSCCMKVRWPSGQEFLEATEQGPFRIRDEFFDVFSTKEGWGITPQFIQTYPQVLQGLDLHSIVYTVA